MIQGTRITSTNKPADNWSATGRWKNWDGHQTIQSNMASSKYDSKQEATVNLNVRFNSLNTRGNLFERLRPEPNRQLEPSHMQKFGQTAISTKQKSKSKPKPTVNQSIMQDSVVTAAIQPENDKKSKEISIDKTNLSQKSPVRHHPNNSISSVNKSILSIDTQKSAEKSPRSPVSDKILNQSTFEQTAAQWSEFPESGTETFLKKQSIMQALQQQMAFGVVGQRKVSLPLKGAMVQIQQPILDEIQIAKMVSSQEKHRVHIIRAQENQQKKSCICEKAQENEIRRIKKSNLPNAQEEIEKIMAASKKLQEPLHSSPINVLGESRISKRRTTQPTGMSDRDYTSPVINEVTSADERTNDLVSDECDVHGNPAVRGDPHQIKVHMEQKLRKTHTDTHSEDLYNQSLADTEARLPSSGCQKAKLAPNPPTSAGGHQRHHGSPPMILNLVPIQHSQNASPIPIQNVKHGSFRNAKVSSPIPCGSDNEEQLTLRIQPRADKIQCQTQRQEGDQEDQNQERKSILLQAADQVNTNLQDSDVKSQDKLAEVHDQSPLTNHKLKSQHNTVSSNENYLSERSSHIRVMQPVSPGKESSHPSPIKEFSNNINHTDHREMLNNEGISLAKLAAKTSITVNSQGNLPTEQVKIVESNIATKNNTAIASKIIASNLSSEDNLGMDLQQRFQDKNDNSEEDEYMGLASKGTIVRDSHEKQERIVMTLNVNQGASFKLPQPIVKCQITPRSSIGQGQFVGTKATGRGHTAYEQALFRQQRAKKAALFNNMGSNYLNIQGTPDHNRYNQMLPHGAGHRSSARNSPVKSDGGANSPARGTQTQGSSRQQVRDDPKVLIQGHGIAKRVTREQGSSQTRNSHYHDDDIQQKFDMNSFQSQFANIPIGGVNDAGGQTNFFEEDLREQLRTVDTTMQNTQQWGKEIEGIIEPIVPLGSILLTQKGTKPNTGYGTRRPRNTYTKHSQLLANVGKQGNNLSNAMATLPTVYDKKKSSAQPSGFASLFIQGGDYKEHSLQDTNMSVTKTTANTCNCKHPQETSTDYQTMQDKQQRKVLIRKGITTPMMCGGRQKKIQSTRWSTSIDVNGPHTTKNINQNQFLASEQDYPNIQNTLTPYNRVQIAPPKTAGIGVRNNRRPQIIEIQDTSYAQQLQTTNSPGPSSPMASKYNIAKPQVQSVYTQRSRDKSQNPRMHVSVQQDSIMSSGGAPLRWGTVISSGEGGLSSKPDSSQSKRQQRFYISTGYRQIISDRAVDSQRALSPDPNDKEFCCKLPKPQDNMDNNALFNNDKTSYVHKNKFKYDPKNSYLGVRPVRISTTADFEPKELRPDYAKKFSAKPNAVARSNFKSVNLRHSIRQQQPASDPRFESTSAAAQAMLVQLANRASPALRRNL